MLTNLVSVLVASGVWSLTQARSVPGDRLANPSHGPE